MTKNLIVTALAAAGLLAAGGELRAADQPTIGISYQNFAFPYVAALQKAAENACQALDVNCVETDAVDGPTRS